ncbi:SDR family oxidoreductase [Natronobacterium gregoryi]|uniref:Male sterility domain-containing protein n=2 Tax=Natronobacterium gregoryi TaxID=44930 RepID=L0AEZ1_NATGS|nr:SDR family oxidoreductase [Natronobacterium gregoryi]AFZ71692.1 non-ribosomal peptide synthase, dehydrogenase domain-containing protein [Natronobacterium gregoryi SP2]ELY72737.1 Male sterility domain-containing protein [Natronobacterium gregoryi SP2]PLK20261.1 Male sterility domain-containing protein [Natronobacterium gregoryi SP2]SFJ25500.1 Thioester reductase domain-containing protein [Natronobacterium gregoryi]
MVAVSDAEVFLTGFPGFLGSALLERILARGDGPVACLVQPQYLETARQRAREITARIDGDEDAIRLYEGDITEPDLGLGETSFGDRCELYHLAAVYDLGVDRDLAEAVNVQGTEHVLEFAERLDVDRFHYVSTCYVSGRYDGVFIEDHLQEGQSFNNHYEETKYRAEVAVRDRMNDGLPATIYRPAIVVGDSQTGETDKYDGPYYLLRLLLAQPAWLSMAFSLPDSSDAELNVVPRNYVVDAIACLSDREETAGEVYQLCDPAPLSVPRFVDVIAEAAGHRTLTLPTTKPIAQTVTTRLESSLPLESATLDYLDHPTRYACPKTLQALEGTGLEVPPFESYVDRLVAYALENPDVGDEAMV